MALRAGYVGIKKTMIGMIEKLSSAKIIKTIGNGLKLTSAGTLSCDIDSNTMEFKNGKLSSKGGGAVFSENEFDTGCKWLDGSAIYGKVIDDFIIGMGSYANVVDLGVKVLSVIDYTVFGISSGADNVTLVPKSNFMQVDNTSTTTKIAVSTAQSGTSGTCTLIVYYVKDTEV